MNWILLATISALLSAAAAVIQKKVLLRAGALQFSFLLSILILIATLFVPFSVDVTLIPGRQLLMILGKSVLGAAAFLLVMYSLKHNQISDALPLLGLTPAATALLALGILGESLRGWEWIGILLMIAGTYILEKKPSQRFFDPFKSLLLSKQHTYIFGAVLLFALSSVVDKALVSNYNIDPLVVLFYQHITYAVVLGCALFAAGSGLHDLIPQERSELILIVTVALLTVAYRLTQLDATKLAPVALVLALKRTSILYASFFGGRLFRDERLGWRLAGAFLIVASGFIILRNVG